MSKTYFVYLLKKHYKMIALLAIISLFFLPLSAINAKVEVRDLSTNMCDVLGMPQLIAPYYPADNYSFGQHTIITMLLGLVIPFFMHNSFYNRNQLDADLALPIKKRKIALTSFVFGLLTLVAISLFSFTIGFSIYAIKGLPLNFGILLLYFLVVIVISLFFYVLVYFSLSFVHTTLDGFMLLALVLLLPVFIGGVISNNFSTGSNTFAYKLESFIYLFNPIPLAVQIERYFTFAVINQPQELILGIGQLQALGCEGVKYYLHYLNPGWATNSTTMLIIYPLLGGLLSFLTVRRIVVDKAEYAGTKETAPHLVYYGIILIAFLAYIAFLDFNAGEGLYLIFFVFVTTAYFVAMFVNARKITLNKRILIPFAIIVPLALIINAIITFTS